MDSEGKVKLSIIALILVGGLTAVGFTANYAIGESHRQEAIFLEEGRSASQANLPAVKCPYVDRPVSVSDRRRRELWLSGWLADQSEKGK